MLSGIVLEIGAEKVMLIGGFILNVAIFWIAFIKYKQSVSDRIDKKIEEKVSIVQDKMETYEAYNTRTHAEFRDMVETSEKRSEKAHDDLREDYVRGIDAVNKRLDDIRELILKLK
jgi:hypothetical protein